ncbi:MAG: hypothetical protein HY980_01165 [Candidatus Magasanikbacteria bacterium]|nr:hypothetical protein [Candidatus Magasanikbacteria bacterium]
MDTKKIAVACFIGGALCCAVALMFAPAYWWLGLLSGIAAGVTSGYISYDFREVCRAVPVALCAAGRGGKIALIAIVYAMQSATSSVKEWFGEPHAIFYPSLAIAVIFYICTASAYQQPLADYIDPVSHEPLGYTMSTFILQMVSALVLEMVGIFFFPFIVLIGTRGDCCYWSPSPYGDSRALMFGEMSAPKREGDKPAPFTYANVARWFVMGLAIIVLFFTWTMWKHLAIGAWATLCFFGQFAWHLFKLIHSEKRVLCALDGTLGGVASYIWLASSATSFAEQAVLVIFGGLLGAAFGVANWEIVSKRILHVPVTGASA